ncbi:MAG: transcription antitermination factor NusB, partial [Coriobacteriia bacterium]
MRATPARRLAASVVERVVRDESWTAGVLDAALKEADLDRREAAFATRLAYGATELLPVLDAAIRARASRPGRIKPRVMAALRVAAYDILMLDTPHAIAVDQGVALVKEHDAYAASFANAVLRKLAADADTFPWGDPESDMAALGRLSGFSQELVNHLTGALGEDAARTFIKGSIGPPPFYVAANPHRTTIPALVAALEAAGSPVTEHTPEGCLRCHEPAAALGSGLLESGSALVADR